MRTLLYLPVVLALAACATAPAPGYRPRPAELADVQGVYWLDNGLILKIYNERRRVFAQLGQREPTELVPVSENRFVSPDRRMTFEYQPSSFGDAIVLTYPSDLKLNSYERVRVRLAAN